MLGKWCVDSGVGGLQGLRVDPECGVTMTECTVMHVCALLCAKCVIACKRLV